MVDTGRSNDVPQEYRPLSLPDPGWGRSAARRTGSGRVPRWRDLGAAAGEKFSAPNRSDIQTVGQNTFGKARGQLLSETPEAGLVKVTNLLIEPITGASYDLVGITPDIPISSGQDALEIAVQQIKGILTKTGAQARGFRRIEALHRMQGERPFKPLNITYDRSDL